MYFPDAFNFPLFEAGFLACFLIFLLKHMP